MTKVAWYLYLMGVLMAYYCVPEIKSRTRWPRFLIAALWPLSTGVSVIIAIVLLIKNWRD